MDIWVRKIKGEWNILKSPSGKYPTGGYKAMPTGCRTKAELIDYLDCQRPMDKRGEKIKLVSA
jgi:hypothetical protein